MNSPRHAPTFLANLARCAARVLAALIASLLLLFMIGEGWNPFTMQLREAIHTLFMPAGVVAGLLLAWRWELAGGLVATLGMAGWHVMEGLASGRFNTAPQFQVIALPGLLFVIAALLRRRGVARPQRACTDPS